ncbi:GTPase LSG1-2 [Ranunculus cassubicifolius]
MVKNGKTGLGRALVKQHNQSIIDAKEKGRSYKKQSNKVIESVTEITDIEAIIERADEAERLFSHDHPAPNLPINLDGVTEEEMTPEERREMQKSEEAAHLSSLKVPRRPPWKAGMPLEQLDNNEKQSFLVWRRSLAQLEENDKLLLTPFEKNLDIWRQLWRVLERSDLLVMVVDARDPLFYRCPDLEKYAREIDEHKNTLLLVNKADLLPLDVRRKWANYFNENGILFLFWSAKAAYAALEGKPFSIEQDSDDPEIKIYGRDELLARLQSEAEAIAAPRRGNVGSSTSKHVVVGFVGYPNVGKSSTINALVGEKKTGVTSTPGKTKHFQTLIISDELMLCDCPGLVFPSFSSSRFEMTASGVLPIDRMTQHRDVVQVVADRVPRKIIEEVYNITLPKPKTYESQTRPPLAAELLRTYCRSRGYVASSGLPDETKAARIILKDYIDGKLQHFELPPGMTKNVEVNDFGSESDEDKEESSDEEGGKLDRVLDDLETFDQTNGMMSKKAAAVAAKKKNVKAHKMNKKPQRKKDRTWRVGAEEIDGMPIVKVFQKAVNVGPLKVG